MERSEIRVVVRCARTPDCAALHPGYKTRLEARHDHCHANAHPARQTTDIEIPIRIYAPEKEATGWICRFEIGWPEGTAKRWGTGSDAVQALLMALQMIGVEVYASRHHESGRLAWLAPGRGYGFPVSNNTRNLLVGEDKKFM
jgi:hypothetical protein